MEDRAPDPDRLDMITITTVMIGEAAMDVIDLALHRVVVFNRLKTTVDMVVNDLQISVTVMTTLKSSALNRTL